MRTKERTTPPMRHESVLDTISGLENAVAAYEARYKQTSEEALRAVNAGHLRETAEIGRWLSSHRVLKKLRAQAQAGHTAGTR